MSDASAPTNPIAITGMHRSGTSMITRGLHQSGLHLIGGDADALLAAADDNPEGFWENKAIVTCNDDLLEAAGGAWDNPPELLPLAVDDPRLAAVVEPATAALAGLSENERWGFKDPRTCLTAAFWLDLQPDLRFVICVRNPLEVALSLKRRNQNSYSLGLSLWERYYESILELVPEDRRIVTHYDTYFLDPAEELARVCEFAGLDPAPLEVRTDLRHHDVGVSLDEANLGAGLRALYTRLCEESGAPAPKATAVDEGQVRRLVLDGTVAARHADQRQQAIERLEVRLAQSQAAEKEAREQLAQVRRESESRRAELSAVTRELDHVRADIAGRFEALARIEEQNQRLLDTTETLGEVTHRLEDRQKATLERTNHVAEILDAVHVKLRAVETKVQRDHGVLGRTGIRGLLGRVYRRLRGRGVPVAKRTVRATAARMPQPVRHNVHRVRRAVADGQAGNRVRERTAVVVHRLPDPAQKVARRGAVALRRSGAVPKAKRAARGLGRRLPAPVKRLVKPVRGAGTAGRRPATRPRKAAPAPRPKQRREGRTAQVPKGPASFKWQKGYERLVDEFVAPGEEWVVMTPGCRSTVGAVGSRTGVAFPSADGEDPAADPVALIAILEAMRLGGAQKLVVPEGSRAWYESHPTLRDHLRRSHRALADRPAAGIVFDLAAAPTERPGVLSAIKHLSTGRHSLPAVLDWTDLDIAGDLPGFTTFAPAGDATSGLPYFDQSVEIVVTTARHDLSEALRVACGAVVVAERTGTRLVVEEVHAIGDRATAGASVTVVAVSSRPEVDEAVRARVDDYGATLRFDVLPGDVDSEIVVLIEAGVVPLPGAIDAMVTATRREPDTVSVGKLLDGRGRIEAAGGMVFADGSVAGIAAGSPDVRASWHEFNRPTCWGRGLISAPVDRWRSLPEFQGAEPVDWFGRVWATGCAVEYRAAAAAVRVDGRPESAVAGGAWTERLSTRPQRPAELGDGSWRYFVANDDVRALAPEGGA